MPRTARKESFAPGPAAVPGASPVDAFSLEDSLGFMARRLDSLANGLFAEMSGQTEVTARQMGILICIAKARLIPLPELSRRMRIDKSTLQEVITRLALRGLVGRRNSGRDRRMHELWLTPTGTAIVNRHLDAARRMEARLIEGLPARLGSEVLKGMKAILDYHNG